MLFSLIFGLIAVFALMIVGDRLAKAPPGSLKRKAGQTLPLLLLVVVIGLIITGRFGWALAALAALAPWIMRGIQVWQMGRTLKDLFGPKPEKDPAQPPPSDRSGGPRPPPRPAGPGMDRAEALRVLNLPATASPEEIQAAYRRLMAQVHPDRGGSDWMAAKLNEARAVLLDGQTPPR